jgi:hypothetical protein
MKKQHNYLIFSVEFALRQRIFRYFFATIVIFWKMSLLYNFIYINLHTNKIVFNTEPKKYSFFTTLFLSHNCNMPVR